MVLECRFINTYRGEIITDEEEATYRGESITDEEGGGDALKGAAIHTAAGSSPMRRVQATSGATCRTLP